MKWELKICIFFFFSSRRRHTRCYRDWSSDVCSSDLGPRVVDLEAAVIDVVDLKVAGRRARSGSRPCFGMKLVIYCAHIGSVPNGRFDWARTAADEGEIERHRGGTEIVDLLDWLADNLAAGRGSRLA